MKTDTMYDLAIIGGGPGGYVAAERAGSAGLSVVLFEKRELGGVCLNEGCIPTKTLLYSAKVYDYSRHADKYGVNVEGSSVDFGAIFKRKQKVVKKLANSMPMTPPPMTTNEAGCSASSRISRLVTTTSPRPSRRPGMGGTAASEPVQMRRLRAS